MINTVYFFCCPPGPPENTAYLHAIVSIAEGLQEIGINTYANIDYWEGPAGFLLKKSSIDYRECDVVFLDSAFYDMNIEHLVPTDIFNPNRKYKLVYNDSSDGLITNGFRADISGSDIILKSHYSTKFEYPANFKPWQFGLTSRIIDQVENLPFNKRKKEFLNNFRVHHPLREFAQKNIAPIFRKVLKENKDVDSFDDVAEMNALNHSYWWQTGRRHYPNYYKRLSESYACFCFGGTPLKVYHGKKGIFWDLVRRVDWHFPFLKYLKIYQFDSWRMWETWIAGCCMVHVDFEKYGILLPVMPVNGEHYLGFDLENISKTGRLVENDPEIFERIGNNGRKWVIDNYSPRKTAERFINIVD